VKWKSWGPWIALLIVAAGALTVAAWPAGTQSLNGHVLSIASDLRCMECEGLSLADSNTTTAIAARADIRSRILHGESDTEIENSYVQRYGEVVLLRPASSGLSLVVWVLPVAVVVVGAIGILFAIRRWRNEPRRVATEEDREIVEDELGRADGDDDDDGGSAP
jgi:cytochrome c-type biogenesis protein CcmH